MALVEEIAPTTRSRQAVHAPTTCFSSVLECDGQTYIQLDTYGSATRKLRHKVSQSIQFDRSAAKQLKQLIERTFPGL